MILIMTYAYMTMCLTAVAAIAIGIFDPYEHREIHMKLIAIMAFIVICCVIYQVVLYKKEKVRSLLISIVLLCGGTIVDAVNYYAFGITVNIVFHTCFITFIFIEIVRMVSTYIKTLNAAAEAERMRAAVMLSQIQPHFLYNTLTGIKKLCDTEPKKASKAIEHFSFYLRSNLDSLSNEQLITFDKELAHVRDYLYLEKMRFEEILSIEWDIGFSDFMIPPLTLQPIVENAVRHGITLKENGGTLRIKSEKNEEAVIVTVTDNGGGFDEGRVIDDGRSHIGLENVQSRLRDQCGGELHIKTVKDLGTEVKITLPIRGDKY